MRTLRWTAIIALMPVAAFLSGCGGDAQTADDDVSVRTDTGTTAQLESVAVSGVGLETPESVLHDPTADVYLVSNINGAPTDEDGNGFIARITPDGAVETLKWIDGERDEVTLDAPKGLALKGDTLFVADITAVRAFHRETGEPLGSRTIDGSTFLNDLAAGPDGTLYVSDSGLNSDFSSSGTDAVYRFEGDEAVAVAEGPELNGPNGLAVHGEEIILVSFAAAEVTALPTTGGERTVRAELPGGQLDGIVVLDDGSLLISSWETSAVYRVPPTGANGITPVVEGVPSPADIGWDDQRQRVLIPVFNENRLQLEEIAPGS